MMIAMKATVYGLREDERPLFAKEAEQFPEIELVLTKEYVTEDSAALAEGADAIMITAPCTITPALARRLHGAGVRYILTRSTGFGHIDRQAIQNYGIRAANVPAYSLNAVPEFCLLLTLNLLRNFKRESKMLEKKDFSLSGIQGKELGAMTVGLFGTGRLGTREAQLFKAMGCRVLAYNPHPREAAKPYVEYVTKETVLREAELIVLQCALNEENRHMINTETIAQMRDGVYLVNTARGGLMNFADVLDGLKSGKIAGLATDVYDHEETFVRKNCAGMDLGDPVMEELMGMENVILTPHIAFFTETAIRDIIHTSLENLREFARTGGCSNEVYQAKQS